MQKGRFDQRRTGQGYKAPAERDGCRNCAHRSAAALGADPDGRIAFNCKLGGFFVAPGGICSKHQLTGIAAVHHKRNGVARNTVRIGGVRIILVCPISFNAGKIGNSANNPFKDGVRRNGD